MRTDTYIYTLAIIMKKHLQNLFFYLFLLLFSSATYGQREKPKYSFKMDEIAAEFESGLRKRKIDTILAAFYFFDNGRGDKATKLLFWTEKGKNYVKAIRTAKNKGFKEFEIKECPEFESILEFYFTNIKDIISSVPKASLSTSHNYGYYIELNINRTEFKTYLRNERRTDLTHSRVKWINMIDQIAKPYINNR